MKTLPAQLILEDGSLYSGIVSDTEMFGASGEVVFTTGMAGYVESLTDPSYTGQILTFTYPLMGNYGIPSSETWESDRVRPSGVIVGESCLHWSHSKGLGSLRDFLKEHKVPLLMGVDTRALTKVLREAGVMLGAIISAGESFNTFLDPNARCLAGEVTTQGRKVLREGDKTVIVVDNGAKANIIRSLKRYPITLVQVPYDYDYTEEEYDAVFLSNGPGDPMQLGSGVEVLKKAMKKEKPIFGICMGMQLLGLAAGGSTYKLRYGHRGHNQPCMESETGRCFITSQNHGFAISEESLPKGWKVSFRNLNDRTVEGISHHELPFSAVQFHPEACPGPTDTMWLFNSFMEKIGVKA